MPVAYGDGVVDRLRSVAPDGVDAVFDLVGGEPLRTVAALLENRNQLISVADKPLGRSSVAGTSSATAAQRC